MSLIAPSTPTSKSAVSMALANHETPFNVGIDAVLTETSLHKDPRDVRKKFDAPDSENVAQGCPVKTLFPCESGVGKR